VHRRLAPWRIAERLAEAGQFDLAIQIAQKIEDAEARSWAFGEIAKWLAKAGQMECALKLAETIEDPISRFHALVAIMAAKREAEKRKKREGQEAK